MKSFYNPKGVSIIAAIFIIVILGFMGLMFLSLINTGTMSAVNDVQSSQALFLAEGGVEYALANRTFPNYTVASTNLGAGSFQVATPTSLNMPPNGITSTIATTPLTVFSTAGFPASGRIVIDSEIIQYTGVSATQFGTTSIVRAQGGTAGATHANGNAVYPVTYVNGTSVAVGDNFVNVLTTTGFTIPGVIRIDNEDIYCTTTTASQFQNCTRGFRGSIPAAHTFGITTNVFQYAVTSTGTAGNASRKVAFQAQRQTLITFDAASSNTTGGSSLNSLSWSHTTFGESRILIVGVSINSSAAQAVTGITYGGQALHMVRNRTSTGGSPNARAELWDLFNPPLGTNTITVSVSGTGGVGAFFDAGAISLDGALQADPVTTQRARNNNNNPTLNITTVGQYSWVVDDLATLSQMANVTVGPGQTQKWIAATTGSIITGASSYEPDLVPSAVTMSWSTANAQWALVAAEIRVAPAGQGVALWQEIIN